MIDNQDITRGQQDSDGEMTLQLVEQIHEVEKIQEVDTNSDSDGEEKREHRHDQGIETSPRSGN